MSPPVSSADHGPSAGPVASRPAPPPDEGPTRQAAERAARQSYGRLVALLAWRWRDLAAAEDALGEAFATALSRWPVDGVPASPDAWLMTAAQRRLLQAARHARLAQDPAVRALFDAEPQAPEPEGLPDERLKLLFVCAHPALPAAVHAPLMLQVVLGLPAAAIASAFLVSPSAMAQRLVRAKARIAAEGLRFEVPQASELPPRLAAVLEGIYAAYTIGSNTAAGLDTVTAGDASLADEALYLARLVCTLQPSCAEAWGLRALLLFCQARRPAQFDAQGRFVPLAQQDPSRWSRPLRDEAEQALWQAAGLRCAGPFQLEAAIQSAHCQRAQGGPAPWSAIVALYAALRQVHDGIGPRLGHAVALARAGRTADALALLQDLPEAGVANHQPYWAALAHVAGEAGDVALARRARQRAIGLTEDPRIRAHLASLNDG